MGGVPRQCSVGRDFGWPHLTIQDPKGQARSGWPGLGAWRLWRIFRSLHKEAIREEQHYKR
jgi:hypothetical protein